MEKCWRQMKDASRNNEVYSGIVKHKVSPVACTPHSIAFENCMLSSTIKTSSVDEKKWSPSHYVRCICGNQTQADKSVDRTVWRSSNPLKMSSQGPRFEYQVGHRLSWFFCYFPQFLPLSARIVLRKGKDNYLSESSQFIIHSSSFHPAVYTVVTDSVASNTQINIEQARN